MAKDFNLGAVDSMIQEGNEEEAVKQTEKKKEKCVTFAFRTSPEVAEKVRRYAFMQNKSIREVMEEIINEALKDVDLPTRNGGKE